MRKMIQSLRHDHRDIEQILRVLEQECDVFCRASRPDYELVGEIIEYLGSFLDQYHHPKEDLLFKIARKSNATCARVIDGIAAERAGAISSLQALGETLREISTSNACSVRPSTTPRVPSFYMRDGRSRWKSEAFSP